MQHTHLVVDYSNDDNKVVEIGVVTLSEGKRKAAALSKKHGLAFVVSYGMNGESLGAIGYAHGCIDTRQGVFEKTRK